HFYDHTIAPYWPPERRHVEDGYRSLPFPFEELPFPALDLEADWPLDGLLGYLKTWSAVKAATKALGGNPVDELEATLRPLWGGPAGRRRICWPLSVRAGRLV